MIAGRRRSAATEAGVGRCAARTPEARHATLAAAAKGLLGQFGFGCGVDAPEGSLAGLLLGSGNFHEVTVQGQIVADGILKVIISIIQQRNLNF